MSSRFRNISTRETGNKKALRRIRVRNVVERAILDSNPDPVFTRIKNNLKNNIRYLYGPNLSDENVRKVISSMQNKTYGKTPTKWRALSWNTIIRNLVNGYPVYRKKRSL